MGKFRKEKLLVEFDKALHFDPKDATISQLKNLIQVLLAYNNVDYLKSLAQDSPKELIQVFKKAHQALAFANAVLNSLPTLTDESSASERNAVRQMRTLAQIVILLAQQLIDTIEVLAGEHNIPLTTPKPPGGDPPPIVEKK